MAYERKVLSKFAYNKVFSCYDVEAALKASTSVLEARHTLSYMRTAKNTVSVKGLRFFDARDAIADFFMEKGVDNAEEGEMVFYIEHGTSLKDPPSLKIKLREWILEAYRQAKRVEPFEKDDSFTIVEFDFSSPCWRKKAPCDDEEEDKKGSEGKEIAAVALNDAEKVKFEEK